MHNIIFYASYYEAIQDLEEEQKAEVYKAIIEYAMEQKEPKLRGVASAIFKMAKPTLDKARKNYENGLKGGRPAQNIQTGTENKTALTTENETQSSTLTQSETQTQTKTQTITELQTEQQTDGLSESNSQNKTESLTNQIFDKEKDKENISLSNNNKKNILSMRARVREEMEEKFKDYFFYWGFEENDKNTFYEVVDVLADAVVQSQSEAGLIFNCHRYQSDYFNVLNSEQIRKIVWQVMNNENIENRHLYILGALINRASEMKG